MPSIGASRHGLVRTLLQLREARRGAPGIRECQTITPPILSHKHYSTGSTFTPESLLREASRQKDLQSPAVPEVCVLDPDGDIVRYLRAAGRAERHLGWACYQQTSMRFVTKDANMGLSGVLSAPHLRF
jgi:hypothetical protein